MNDTLPRSLAARLNAGCHCIRPDRARLRQKLAEGPSGQTLLAALEQRPGLFSDSAVFLDHEDATAMAQVIALADRVVSSEPYRARVLAGAPQMARLDRRNAGGILGFDFHLSADGPRLIEVNTNAGGALLNVELGKALAGCCVDIERYLPLLWRGQELGWQVIETLQQEWRQERGDAALRTVAIVDDAPEQQYLYPEFLLFQQRLQWRGWSAVVVDPQQLVMRDGAVWHRDTRIDLVYNRLTDFYLEEPRHAALREAHAQGAVVLTPHPRAHALWADKRNLVLLRDDDLLAAAGLAAGERLQLLAMVPATEVVDAARAESLWQRRRQLFFKPACGYASKAAYRGDKLTRSTFAELLAHPYVAQDVVAPSSRSVVVDGVAASLKADVRCYAYQGRVLLMAARLYQGQTTNFRTAGGGFAPVMTLPDDMPGLRPAASRPCCTPA